MTDAAPMNVYEEQRLYHTSQDRERYETMATLYSLITCLDYLERAYVRGAVHDDAYASQCTRLLGQYKTVVKLVTDPSQPAPYCFSDVQAFMTHFHMDCPAALHRLNLGIPATIEHGSSEAHTFSHARDAQLVAETTQNFITLMDALKLQMRAKDQLHPLLSDVLSAYARTGAENDDSRAKLLEWLITLNKLSASDELDEAQVRQVRCID